MAARLRLAMRHLDDGQGGDNVSWTEESREDIMDRTRQQEVLPGHTGRFWDIPRAFLGYLGRSEAADRDL